MITELRRGSLLVIFLTVFIDLLGFGIVLPLLPIYAKRFTLDPSGLQLGLLMASFSAMQFFFAPVWGRVSDRIGRRPVIMVGLLGSIIFYSLFGIATIRRSMLLLFVSRIGAGLAGATISTAQAYIADCTTLEQRPRGMALIGMAFGLGFTFGPLLGFLAVPDAAQEPGPMPGFAAAILSAIALLLAIFVLPES
ncbi:MAG: MFS transporter, partial [Planctomycetales bacterium]|nr:MFS transporter [Planctomycetales bacterium]